jgi:aminoglycoside phosphotransferase (APT) family kinase protein
MTKPNHDPGLIHLRNVFETDHSVRDAPSDDFIQAMHKRFPTEREFDAMLTRKMQHRHHPRRPATSLNDFASYLDAFLKVHVQGDFEVSRLRWMTGGGSKIQLAFELKWHDPDQGQTRTELVIRMEPQESLNATSRMRESQLIRAFSKTLPVPRVYWVDADGKWFPEPSLIYAFATGVTKPRAVEGRISGVGNDFGTRLRTLLAPQFVTHLATIHTFDFSSSDFGAFDIPRLGTTDSALWQLNRARRIWEEDRAEDLPIMEIASNWLERNLPLLDAVSVLHGDYRAGNFLFDEETGKITAWLDWERGYLGDRHRDLAWTTMSLFGNYDVDRTTLLVSGLVPLDDFYLQYEALSGLKVDTKRLHFYRIMNSFQLIASVLGTGYRVARLGRSHQDILLSWIEGAAYQISEDLRVAILEEGN